MGVADDFAPSFTQKPQLRQEDEGNRLIFECQLISSPKPEISWFRGETQLSEDGRTNFKIQSVETNKFLVVLELDDVIETDAGLYKVKAKNKMGEVAASINLNFSRKFTLFYIHFFFRIIFIFCLQYLFLSKVLLVFFPLIFFLLEIFFKKIHGVEEKMKKKCQIFCVNYFSPSSHD